MKNRLALLFTGAVYGAIFFLNDKENPLFKLAVLGRKLALVGLLQGTVSTDLALSKGSHSIAKKKNLENSVASIIILIALNRTPDGRIFTLREAILLGIAISIFYPIVVNSLSHVESEAGHFSERSTPNFNNIFHTI